MHDGIHLEQAGVPSATICTDAFVETSEAMAAMWGAADYPVIFIEHPLEGLDKAQLRARAEAMLDRIVAIVT